jgi:hypothetical protein
LSMHGVPESPECESDEVTEGQRSPSELLTLLSSAGE